jgi:cyclic pyranopterin monophosphate synthase
MPSKPDDAVRVVCFGWLRERLGGEILVREPVATVLDLWSAVTHDHADLGDPRGRLRVARNLGYCDWETEVKPGDEVAFMPPVAGGSVDDEPRRRVHTALVADPIEVDRLVAEARGDADGAIAAFIGVVRNRSPGGPVQALDYDAYLPMAERELLRVAAEVTEHHDLSALTMVHRIGTLAVGEVSVVVVAAAPHRGAALLACSEAVEALKRDLPVWKREHHADGAFWVDAREPDGVMEPGGPAEASGSGAQAGAAGRGADSRDRDDDSAPEQPRLSHLDRAGSFHMVDVSDRPTTLRTAVAEAVVRFANPATVALVREGSAKGDVLAAARLAGIMGAKHTPELLPLCHPLPITHLDVQVEVQDFPPGVRIVSSARCTASTGVEMEALTAASIAGLTVMDMVKSVDPWVTIEAVRLLRKSGGRSGAIQRP